LSEGGGGSLRGRGEEFLPDFEATQVLGSGFDFDATDAFVLSPEGWEAVRNFSEA
jgi:hypothetical protein